MEKGENLLMQIWWNDQGWERPCKAISLPVCNISKEGSCDPKDRGCSDSTIFSEYAKYLKFKSDFDRVGKGKYVFFISRTVNDDSLYLIGYFVVADKKKDFLNKTLTKISGAKWTFDFAIMGDRDLSKRLFPPIRFDRKLVERLELPLKHPKDGRDGGIEFDRVDKNGRQLNDLECIAQGTRMSRKLSDNDVKILLDTIDKNHAIESKEIQGLKFPDLKTVKPTYIKNELKAPPSSQEDKSKRKKQVKIESESEEHKKEIGKQGELIVFEEEKRRLIKAKCPDLAKKVDHISLKDDSAGYDILSFRKDDSKKYIEVKSTEEHFSGKRTEFEITATQVDASKTYGDNYYIYRVFDVASKKPPIKIIKNPYKKIKLEPKVYNAAIYFE